MRHVTDGELHAYLDGALDALPDGRAEEVRSHLAACSSCQERLQDEEELRTLAGDVLAGAAPTEDAAPPFEELRDLAAAGVSFRDEEEAARPVRRWKPLGGLPLAWAATVVLALGVGWMGGQVWRNLPSDQRIPASVGPEEAELDRPEGQESVVGGVRNEVAGSRGADSPVEATVPAAARLLESAEEKAPGPAPNPVTLEDLAAVRRELRPEDTVAALDDVRERADALPAARQAPSLTQAAAFAPGGDSLTLRLEPGDDAPADNPLAVPGLEVLDLEWEEWIPGEKALHIRQLLPSGDTLELRYLGMLVGRDPDLRPKTREAGEGDVVLERPHTPKGLEATLPPGWNQVVMRWGRGWLVARAPLPQASIRGLLRSLF